jgi:hypothetical protein
MAIAQQGLFAKHSHGTKMGTGVHALNYSASC